MGKMRSILTIGLLVLLVGLVLIGCRSKEVESALIYINQQNDWDKAMEQLALAIQVNPADAEAHMLRGKGYGHFGNYDKMVEEFKTVESLIAGAPNPKIQNEVDFLRDKYWRLSFNTGVKNVRNIETDTSALDKATKNFEDCVLIAPDRPESYKNLAFVYVQKNDLKAAISNYEALLKVNNKDVDALSSLSNLYINTKQYNKCIETTDKILAIDPTNVEATAQKAMAYDLLGDSEKAFGAYEIALKSDPDNVDLIFNLGRLYYQGKDYQKAIEKFKSVLEKKPNDYEANVNIGNAYLLIAEKIMQKYRDMDEKQLAKVPKAEFDADQQETKKYYKAAVPYLEKAVVTNLDKKGAWYNLAVAYVQAGEAKKGEKCFAIADEVEAGQYLQASNFIDEFLPHLK